MFNTFDEHLFVCQSLLKEWRQPPTGGLREALKESLRGGVSTPSSPIVGSKTTLGASEVQFPPTLWGIAPIGAFPVGASFLVVGAMKGLILIVCKTLRVFRGAVFEEEVLSLLHKLRLEQGGMPKGQVPEFLASRFP